MKHGCMVMTLRLSSSRRSGSRHIYRGRKSALSSHQCQVHVDCFFDIQGIVHKEFVPPGQTVNCKFYCEVLKWLRESIRCKRPDKWKKEKIFSPPWKAPAHTSLGVRQFQTSKNITVIPHTPHPLFDWHRPLRLFPTSQEEITAERASFWHHWGDPRRNATGYRHTYIWEHPWMHEIMGNTLG